METTDYQFTAQQFLEQEKLKESKTPIEEAFKVNYGSYPIVDETASEYDGLAWNAFKKGYFAGQFIEKQVFYIDTAKMNMSKDQAEQYIKETMIRYRNRLNFNVESSGGDI